MILEDGTTVPYIIEINPRFSTTVSLTIESGVDEVDLSIRDQLNIPFPPLSSFKEDLVMIRYEDHLFTNEKDILGK